MEDAAAKLPTPRIINLVTDPQEREPVSLPYLHSWAATHFNKILGAYKASVEREPPIPMGAPLDHVPAART
jgi:arylsulfatase